MALTNHVADVVHTELARRRKTQNDLAKALHLTPPSISRRMTGQTPWDLRDLEAASRFLRVPVSRLIREAEARRVDASL